MRRSQQNCPRSARVLHIAQTTAGGIASYFEEIAGYQSKRFGAANVAFLVPDAKDHRPSIDTRLIRTFRSSQRGLSALLEFALTARKTIDEFRPNIIHLHSSFAGAIVRAMLAFRRNRPKIIYCPHGWAFSMEVPRRRQKAYALIERRLAGVTDLIHNVSHSEQALAIRYRLPAAKMRVLANGIAWVPAPLHKKRSGPLRFLFIGRLDRQKGADILLENIKDLPPDRFRFDIVGSHVLSKASDGSATVSGHYPNATFHGWLERQRALELLDCADAVLMPSRWDAAPIVAIEAMRAGVPVLGSNRGALPEIIGEGVGGHVFRLDESTALRRLIERLDRKDLARLGRSARQRWEAHYCSDRMNADTCSAYQAVLAGKHLQSTELEQKVHVTALNSEAA